MTEEQTEQAPEKEMDNDAPEQSEESEEQAPEQEDAQDGSADDAPDDLDGSDQGDTVTGAGEEAKEPGTLDDAELKDYLGVKRVRAMRMNLGDYNDLQGWTIPEDQDPATEGFVVVYPDGYISWCPREQFESHNRVICAMTFGHAIEAMRQGNRVARAGWNGKDMFLFFNPPSSVEVTKGRPLAKTFPPKTPVEMAPYIMMKTAAPLTTCVPWLASQTDMLADDWFIVE